MPHIDIYFVINYDEEILEKFHKSAVNSIWGGVPPPLTEKKFVEKTANAIKMIFTSVTKILLDNF